jgi:predicted metal-dependent peptidase
VGHETEPKYLRPPRRFPDMVGVLPGNRRVPTKLKILAAVDTSGSMAATTLDEIAAELRVMARSYDVAVVEFDMVIQRRYRLGDCAGPYHQGQPAGAGEQTGGAGEQPISGDPLTTMRGRGGTSFLPVF